MSDNIIVQWQDDGGGWREGVLCAVLACENTEVSNEWMLDCFDYEKQGLFAYDGIRAECVIWDRHRSERAVVSLSKVSLVKPRCEICEGTGELMVTRYSINHETLELMSERSSEPCPVCQGTGKDA